MTPVTPWFSRLAAVQARRAVAFVLIGVALALGSVPFVMRLGLDTTFEALLPKQKPSVLDLEHIRGRLGGLSTLTVAVESADHNVPAMQHFAAALVPKLQALQDYGVRSVEWNVTEYEDFVRKNKGLYADIKDLAEIKESLEERLEYEKSKANPLFFDLNDEEPPSADVLIDKLKKKADAGESKLNRFPGGYYIHPDHDMLAIFLRTDIRGGDVASAQKLMVKVQSDFNEVGLTQDGSKLTVEFGGDLLHAREEHDEIAKELTVATSLTIFLVLTAMWLYFRRFGALPVLGFGLMVPVLMTFACAQLFVGKLNTSTAFLASIVVGNGINPFIIWLSRYFEERASGHAPEQAVSLAHQGTWMGTLAASSAAGLSYGSLILTDFRGFRDFGIIGGIGMALCWTGTITLLPCVAVFYERFLPFKLQPQTSETPFQLLLSKTVFSKPKVVLGASALLTLAAVTSAAVFIAHDPIEYDFRNLKSVRESSSRASSINGRVKAMVGSAGAGQGIAIVLPSVDEAHHIKNLMQDKIKAGEAQYSRVRSLDDLLPTDQDKKVPLLKEIRDDLLEARRFAKPEQKQKIDDNTPPEDVHALTFADLPESVARPFTEKDGTRGRILFVEQKADVSLWDGRYLVKWAEDLRTLRMQNGERPPLAGQAPVFADMLEVVWIDGPKAVLVSFLTTALLVFVALRRFSDRLLALSVLMLGIVLMVGAMAAFHIKLNFLNFVVFPITFGIGLDYSINVLKRYVMETEHGTETERAIHQSIGETGRAVALCSLTTIIGYSSLFVSANRALNSFGAGATLGEITCLGTAVVTMPALMLVLHRRRKAPR
ncbi:MAG TPA: MMPL family transporter [Polyangiaceae bacterium]|nr:MMPL family transporter [Polyangiaceae bacterium]